MTDVSFDAVNVGDRLPDHERGPVTRTVLALFAGAAADHNPMHVDIDFAKKFGMPDVFAHGMLSMAYLAQLLTRWVRQDQIVKWNVRFVSITPVLATVICTGEVVEKFDAARQVRLAIRARVKGGPDTLVGEAIISFA